MRALLAVELRRLIGRRLFRWITALAIAGFVVVGTGTYLASDDSPAAVAEARARYEAEVAGCVEHTEIDEHVPAEAHRDPAAFCREQVWMDDPRFVYREATWILSTFAIPFAMLGWLIGASFIGAEWHNRTITALLTWEPRRIRVLGTKMVAAAVVVFAWLVILQTLFSASLYPAAAFEGTTAGLTSTWWASFAGVILRASAVGALAALLGTCIAAVGRNTAAALGIGFVYLAMVESVVRAFKPGWADWLIGDNVALFLMGSADVNHLSHSQTSAGLLLIGYAAAMVVASMAVFRRREIA